MINDIDNKLINKLTNVGVKTATSGADINPAGIHIFQQAGEGKMKKGVKGWK